MPKTHTFPTLYDEVKTVSISFKKYIDNYFDLHHTLVNLFQRKVDLVTEQSL